MSFTYFSTFIAMARIIKTMLNKSGETGYLCLVPNLRGNAFNIFTIEYNVSCGLVIYGLYYFEVGFIFAHFLENFYDKQMLNFVKSFFCIYPSIKIIIWFLFFNWLIWCMICLMHCWIQIVLFFFFFFLRAFYLYVHQ